MDLAASAWNADGTAPSDGNRAPVRRSRPDARSDSTPDGQPILNYDAVYPTDPVAFGYDAARAGMPIVRMVDDDGATVHSDLNGVIAGPKTDGWKIPAAAYPADYWTNEVVQENQRRGEEPFREFTVIFHDDIFAIQAFPELFDDPATFQHTLHGVRDGFGINYGVGGVGAEVIANRLKNAKGGVGVGPMADCIECKYEEFFLTAWAVGDPAMIVDVPANKVLAGDAPAATMVRFPDDPSNVHHSYLNDRVKFRNLHAGPKEHHIFHLHAHQWQQTPNERSPSYLDSRLIGPGGACRRTTSPTAGPATGTRPSATRSSTATSTRTSRRACGSCGVRTTPSSAEPRWTPRRPAPGAWLPRPSRRRESPPGPRSRRSSRYRAGRWRHAAASDDVVATMLPGASQPSSQVDVNGDGTADVEQGWLAGMESRPREPRPPRSSSRASPGTARRPPRWTSRGEDGGLSRHVITGGRRRASSHRGLQQDPRHRPDHLRAGEGHTRGAGGDGLPRHAVARHLRLVRDPVNGTEHEDDRRRGPSHHGLRDERPAAGARRALRDPCRTDGTGSSRIRPEYDGSEVRLQRPVHPVQAAERHPVRRHLQQGGLALPRSSASNRCGRTQHRRSRATDRRSRL